MSQSSWISARRATVTLSAGEIGLLMVGCVLAFSQAPRAATVLAGAALAPLLTLVAALTMHGAEPLRAGRFLLRLALARGTGALVAGGVATLLHLLFGLPWVLLAVGFSVALLLQQTLAPWVARSAVRRPPSCRASP